MASEIIVNTIKAPTTGANANKVIIPSGVTLDASAGTLTCPTGFVVNTARESTISDASTTGSSFNTIWTFNYTPVLSNSKVFFTHCLNLRGFNGGGHDGRFRYRVSIAGVTALDVNDAGGYDYGGNGIWLRAIYSETLEYTNTSGSSFQWSLQVTAPNSSGVRFNEPSSASPVSTCLIQEIAQ
jgi:hypothetical protein